VGGRHKYKLSIYIQISQSCNYTEKLLYITCSMSRVVESNKQQNNEIAIFIHQSL